MSYIEYRKLLLEAGRRIDQQIEPTDLLFICKERVSSGNVDITGASALSLFEEMEEQANLGIDRLEVLKEVLKGAEEWSLFQKVKTFEMKRKEYNDLLELISCAVDECNHLEQLTAICKRKRWIENDVKMQDVRTLLKELEKRNYLEFGHLGSLKEIFSKIQREDLLMEVNDFEKRRNDEDEIEIRKGKLKTNCVIRKLY